MVKLCAARSCSTKWNKESCGRGITFHKFPQVESQKIKWLENAGRLRPPVDKKHGVRPHCIYLCSKHFLPECYHPGHRMKKLKRGAEPTIFAFTKTSPEKRCTSTPIMAETPPPRVAPTLREVNVDIQQEHDYAQHRKPVEVDDMKRKLEATRKELTATKKRLKRRDDSLTTVANKLVELTLMKEDERNSWKEPYSKLQMELCGVTDARTAKFTDDLREFATTLYIYSPKAYDFVRKYFCLPHQRTVRRWFAEPKMDGQPYIPQEIIDTLGLMDSFVYSSGDTLAATIRESDLEVNNCRV